MPCPQYSQRVLDFFFSDNDSTVSQGDCQPTEFFQSQFYFQFLDLLVSELQKRFSAKSCEIMVELSASRPSKWNRDNLRNLSNYSKRYGLSEKSLAVELLMKEKEERAKVVLKTHAYHFEF